MANNFFQFKQFLIEQGQTAMKVSTEACLFGSWVASIDALHPTRILDIGTGTGLLALMLAQQFDCPIDAIELDNDAAKQAQANFDASPWQDRLRLIHENAINFMDNNEITYDLIISNPPFFANHATSGNISRNQAIHQESLTQQVLADLVKKLLSAKGHAAVLYPVHEATQFIELSKHRQLYPLKSLNIQDRVKKPIFRQFNLFQNGFSQTTSIQNLVIKDEESLYTEQFVQLLKPYYLYL